MGTVMSRDDDVTLLSAASFSLGSWCHFVGTGGGTATALCSGLARRLVSDGFCFITVEALVAGDLAAGSPSPPEGEEAGRLTPAIVAVSLGDSTL